MQNAPEMSVNKLELAITKDKKSRDVELDAMSLEAAKAFVVLVESLTNIVALTPNNEEIKIKVQKGSAAVILEGKGVSAIQANFSKIVNNNSTNKALVGQWRKIQELFTANGLEYKANSYTSAGETSILNLLRDSKKLRAKRTYKPPIQTQIRFIDGKLIAVGGKNPNIHIEGSAGEKTVIACTEKNAKKAMNYLYSPIMLSVWAKENNVTKSFEMCDSYSEKQREVRDDFISFLKEFTTASDEVASLKLLHYKCRRFVENADYVNLVKFIRLFNHESSDINILKTILIITHSLLVSENIIEIRGEIKRLFDHKISSGKL